MMAGATGAMRRGWANLAEGVAGFVAGLDGEDAAV